MFKNNFKEWLSWFLLSMFFFGHYFFRISPQLMDLELMKTFSLSVSDMGLLYQAFFLPYTLAQLPVGFCLRRFSTKWLITIACFMCAAATYLFSQANSFFALCLATVLYACCAAFGFVGAITYANTNLPEESRSLAAGGTQGLGMVGGFLGTILITKLMASYSWQNIMIGISIGLTLLAFMIGALVPKTPVPVIAQKNSSDPSNNEPSIFLQMKTWTNALYVGFMYLPLSLLTESFGKRVLTAIHGHDVSVISVGVSLIFAGWFIGGPICGMIADRIGRIPVMKFTAFAGFAFMALLLYVPLSPLMLQLSLFFFGLTNTGIVGCYAISAEMYGPSQASVSIAIANMATILVGVILLPSLAKMLELSSTPMIINDVPLYAAADYQHTFGLVLLAPMIAYVCAMLTPETKKV